MIPRKICAQPWASLGAGGVGLQHREDPRLKGGSHGSHGKLGEDDGELGKDIFTYTLWLFNIAMENPF